MSIHYGGRGPGHLARVQGGRTDWIFTSGGLDPRITFTRASSGTYFDSAGVMQTATTDVPRFNYEYNGSSWVAKGLLIEPAATNLLLRSREFDSASWSLQRSSIAANATTAPDGSANADRLIDNTVSGTHRVYQAQAKAGSAITYTGSVFLKADTLGFATVRLTGAGESAYSSVGINLSTGELSALSTTGFTSASAAVAYAGDGWWRLSLTATSDTTTSISTIIGTATSLTAGASYVGSGAGSIYLWGAQIETDSNATSFIETTSATATRAADVAVMTGTNFSSFYNQSEGTWVAEWTSVSSSSVVAQISDATNSNRFQILHDNGGQTAITTGGVGQGAIDAGTVSTTGTNKFAFAYKVNDTAASLNGGAVGTDTTVTLPVVDRITLGATVAPANHLNGHLARLTYYPTRLSNAQLATLST